MCVRVEGGSIFIMERWTRGAFHIKEEIPFTNRSPHTRLLGECQSRWNDATASVFSLDS